MSFSDFGLAALAVFTLMNITSFFAIQKRRNDFADVIWGPGFLLSGIALLLFKIKFSDGFEVNDRKLCILVLTAIWALRLFLHIGVRNLKKPDEDARYLKMRRSWGDEWRSKSYTRVFILQGAIMLVIALPIYITISSPSVPLDYWSAIAIAIWLFGFVVESLADQQLSVFVKDPSKKGKIMSSGLWSWSRHPNYFGEIVQWWGIFLLSLPVGQAWISVLSPIGITFMILKISGVTMLENQMRDRPGYKEYQAKTSQFFLWPPKK